MSGDPERLLSVSSGADPLERELLDSVRRVGPPSGAKDEAWRGIAAQIAVVAAVGAAAGTTAAASKAGASGLASWALATKVAVVALGGSLALGGGYFALREPQASPSAAPRPVVAPPKVEARPVPAAEVPQDPLAPLDPPHAEEEAPSRKLEPRRLDLLKAESALLMQARAELRAGNAVAAQSALEKLQAQFPKGMLSQEREVLAVEVLHARGNVDGARRRAKAFIKAYPKSPHSQKLARFVE